MPRSLVLAAGAAAALAALAVTFPVAEAQPTHAAGVCFNLNNIQGERVPDDRDMYFRADAGRVYHLEFGSDCPNATTYTLVLHPFDNGNQICGANELDVHVRNTGAQCIPTSLTVLSPEEVAALPPKDRP
jgi:hypothetical protein